MAKVYWWFALIVGCAGPAVACNDFAQTPLETAFCTLQSKAPDALPYSLRDFRKNPAKTQRLLLERIAARHGVALPAPSPARPAPAPAPAPVVSTPPSATAPRQARLVSPGLDACTMLGDAITCPHGIYRLLGNLPLQRVSQDALTEPLMPGTLAEHGGATSVELAASYRQYLNQMVHLGLAAATMSYTKYVHTYQQASAAGADFNARMHTMFELLQRDRASLGVQAHYTSARPDSLAACAEVNATLVACDNVHTNWLYQKHP